MFPPGSERDDDNSGVVLRAILQRLRNTQNILDIYYPNKQISDIVCVSDVGGCVRQQLSSRSRVCK